MINSVHDMVMDDRRLAKREIAEAMGISDERALHILHNELGLKKLLARWAPHSLILDQKCTRVRLSQEHLARFQENKADFVRRFVTMDETWVYHYDPELRQ